LNKGASHGFVYVASRPSYVEEAARSWATVHRHHPDAEAVVTTDCPDLATQLLPGVTVRVLQNPQRHHADKILPLADSPFERTIFLDTDVLLAAPLDDLFLMLERYDLLVARDPWGHHVPGMPATVRQYNTGLLGYRTTAPVQAFFRDWAADYDRLFSERGRVPGLDQYSFQRRLHATSLRWYLLSAEYNFRTIAPGFLRYGERVMALHGRQEDLPRIGTRLNRHADRFRLYCPNLRALAAMDVAFASAFEDRVFRFCMWPIKTALRLGHIATAGRRFLKDRSGGR
jgi:hypothetical protein